MFPHKEDYKSDHVILDKRTYQNDLKSFSFTFLELGKFNKSKQGLHTMLEKWTYYFKYAEETSEEDLDTLFKEDLIIQRAYRELDCFSWCENDLTNYENVIRQEALDQACLDQRFKEEKAKGREKGYQEALVQVAKNMLQQGTSIHDISFVTTLKTQDIQRIQQER